MKNYTGCKELRNIFTKYWNNEVSDDQGLPSLFSVKKFNWGSCMSAPVLLNLLNDIKCNFKCFFLA